MKINFITECDMQGIDLIALNSLAETVLAKECENDSVRVTVLLTGDEVLQELNFKFFGIDEPTDVLAFPDAIQDDAVAFPQQPSDLCSLGDIAISVANAERKSSNSIFSLQEEVAHLLTHACLHLCGFDHETVKEMQVMQKKEENYLKSTKIHT
tara:strand:+ start:5211 stop:5672 length:462 start_codon:yes stop_codon:yes gene_type:complete